MEENKSNSGKKILFSIIVPVYNTEKYIEKCLSSIVKAIDVKEDFEVIIINDGSKDNAEEKIKNFISKLDKDLKNRFIYIKKENKGLADTKNVGISKARGEFISVIDSDDYVSDDFYRIARKYTSEFDIIIYDLYVVFEKNKKQNYTSRAYRDYMDDELRSYLNGAMSGSSCNKIIKKELYNGYQFPVGKEYEDTAVTPFVLTDAKKIKYVPYPMYYYLQREKSIVASNTFSSAFYKICSNLTDVINKKSESADKKSVLKKYSKIIQEFIVERILDNFNEDYSMNKNKFIDNIKSFKDKNTDIIDYIVDNDLVYNDNEDSHYSKRQKEMVKNIFELLKNENYNKVKNLLFERKVINKLRKLK